LFYVLKWINHPVDFIFCLLFGALISPTDPIAVLGILTKSNVLKKLEIDIVGESLFNDGIGIVLFISILEIIRTNSGFHMSDFLILLFREAGGGILFGWALGYVMYLLMKSIDDYQTEVIITLAGVMGGYFLANQLHISGPLAMVVAGLFTGSRSKDLAMSETTELYVDKFWELIDVLMNAILFVLIGLQLITLEYNKNFFIIGLLAIPIILCSRYLAIRVPQLLLRKWINLDRKAIFLMTWGGLRGGLSIAMALSLKYAEQKDMFVFVTYIVVLFSIMVQGLSMGKLARSFYPAKPAEAKD